MAPGQSARTASTVERDDFDELGLQPLLLSAKGGRLLVGRRVPLPAKPPVVRQEP